MPCFPALSHEVRVFTTTVPDNALLQAFSLTSDLEAKIVENAI